jgi:hypothetical protein
MYANSGGYWYTGLADAANGTAWYEGLLLDVSIYQYAVDGMVQGTASGCISIPIFS